MHGLMADGAGGAWTFGSSILTFAFPMILFIVVAGALYVLYTKPESVPGHHVPGLQRSVSYTAVPGKPSAVREARTQGAAEAAQARPAAAGTAGIVTGATAGPAATQTAAPETAATQTAAPETAAPETTAPETTARETAVPGTGAPETRAPGTEDAE